MAGDCVTKIMKTLSSIKTARYSMDPDVDVAIDGKVADLCNGYLSMNLGGLPWLCTYYLL
jgi:hypothetical protein